MLREGTVASVCAFMIWIGGCPKRQAPKSLVVYVPAPAPAAAAPAAEQQVLVIQEPASPPEPEAPPPRETTEPSKATRSGRRGGSRPAQATTPAEPDETPTEEDSEPPPPAEVPALEPRESSAQQNELRNQYLKLEQDVRQRLAHFNGVRLSSNDQKTLEDARTFFAQATQAMQSGDLPRAWNLAHKASLLLAALE